MTPDALLEAILEDPEDDALRLVYADWLEERGDPRGEFIRVQCQLAQMGEDDLDRPELLARERRLLQEHGPQWVRPMYRHLSGLVRTVRFHRGFVAEVAVDVRAFRVRAESLFRLAPIQHLTLYLSWGGLVPRPSFLFVDRILGWVADLPLLTCLQTLDLSHLPLSPDTVRALAASPHLAGLTRLILADNRIGDESARAMAATPHLSRLAVLVLHSNYIQNTGALALAESATLARLTVLDLTHNPIGSAGRTALRGRFGDRVKLSGD